MQRVYFDYSATTPLDPRVLDAMQPYWSAHFGNASSVHAFGREARLALEESREQIARAIGASSDELFFTAGGTESDNHALTGVLTHPDRKGNTGLVTSLIEHHAVLHTAERLREDGANVVFARPGPNGVVDPDEVRSLSGPNTGMVSVMHANNETGVIQPIEKIVAVAHEQGALFHSDAVQTLGKISIDMRSLPVDMLSFSAHKIHGPKGIGAIYIRKGTKIRSFLVGGAQESNRRAGTESVPLAVGFAKAVLLSVEGMAGESKRLELLKANLKSKLLHSHPALRINGEGAPSLANILSVSFDSSVEPIDGESLIMGMDLKGVAVTSGSACTSGSLQPSHVLLAMGRDEKTARATIRFSFGRFTKEEEIDIAVAALDEVVRTASKR